MKKKAILAIFAAILIIFTTSCGNDGKTTENSKKNTSTFEGISVEVLSAEIQQDETVLSVRWKNESEYQAMYGEGFSIQKWENGSWVDCTMNENTAFTSIGYLLEPGKFITKGYQLRWLYGDLQPGQYRFLTSCSVWVGHNREDCQLTSEFTLKDAVPARIFDLPPELWIIHTGKDQAAKGTYSWNYILEDGKMACVNADASHPLVMKEDLNLITSGDRIVVLEFEDWPDYYTVRCWPGGEENTSAAGEAVTTWSNSVELKAGDYVYEVTAIWDDDGTGYFGTVTYVFYAAPSGPYDVMPITT